MKDTARNYIDMSDAPRFKNWNRIKETRAEYLMRVASKYIVTYCPDEVVFYDDAECDGFCLAEELFIEATGNEFNKN